jgi:octaprenyl-diphosphate synthase
VIDKCSPEIESACASYGQALGTAFQVIDDVLDYEGDAAELGKNLGDDLREGKTTLPLIIAMQRGTPDQQALIRRAIEEGDASELPTLMEIVRTTGAMESTRAAAGAEARRAMQALETLPTSTYRDALWALAEQLLDRRS